MLRTLGSGLRVPLPAASAALPLARLHSEIVERTAMNLAQSIQSGPYVPTNDNVRDQSYSHAMKQLRRLYVVEVEESRKAREAQDSAEQATLHAREDEKRAAREAVRLEKAARLNAERAVQAAAKAKITAERAERRLRREQDMREITLLNVRRLDQMSQDFVTRENIDEYLRTALVRRTGYNRGLRTLMPSLRSMEQLYAAERVARANRKAGRSVTAEALRRAQEIAEADEKGLTEDRDAPAERLDPPAVNPPRSSHFFFVDRSIATVDRNPYEDPLLPWAPGYGSEVEVAGTEHELAGSGFNASQLAQRRAAMADDYSDDEDDLSLQGTKKKKQPNKGSKKNKKGGRK